MQQVAACVPLPNSLMGRPQVAGQEWPAMGVAVSPSAVCARNGPAVSQQTQLTSLTSWRPVQGAALGCSSWQSK